MVFHTIAVASTLWLAADGAVHITEAQLEAAQFGHILGAAAQCQSIDQRRISDATHHASLAVRALVSTPAEFETARGSFDDAAVDGGASVNTGRESCEVAEQDLKRIEQKFGGK